MTSFDIENTSAPCHQEFLSVLHVYLQIAVSPYLSPHSTDVAGNSVHMS
jgi:hypothetical protein